VLAAFFAAFAAVFLLELPDKTTALTLVLSTRYRARAVFAGAAVAFLLQAAIAVGLGSVITLLPGRIVAGAVAVLFGVGAVLLIRESLEESDKTSPNGADMRAATPMLKAAGASFVLLFTAEWGDASQVTAIGVAAHYDHPVMVFLGAFLALMAVTTLALVIGKKIRDRVPAHFIQRGAAAVFVVFAIIAAVEAIAG